MAAETPKLLWNPDNVKDVAESVGISSLNEEALKCLTQDVEYRVGQVIVEALRFMRASRRTTLTVNDISLALKALDVEPLYGYDSTRPLRYGEASLGPGQPLFYIEDEEIDFEKLINAPLPKVPRDMGFTGKSFVSTSRIILIKSQRTGSLSKEFSPPSLKTLRRPNLDRKNFFPRALVPTPLCLLSQATTMSP
jgi:histone H3/H4